MGLDLLQRKVQLRLRDRGQSLSASIVRVRGVRDAPIEGYRHEGIWNEWISNFERQEAEEVRTYRSREHV